MMSACQGLKSYTQNSLTKYENCIIYTSMLNFTEYHHALPATELMNKDQVNIQVVFFVGEGILSQHYSPCYVQLLDDNKLSAPHPLRVWMINIYSVCIIGSYKVSRPKFKGRDVAPLLMNLIKF